MSLWRRASASSSVRGGGGTCFFWCWAWRACCRCVPPKTPPLLARLCSCGCSAGGSGCFWVESDWVGAALWDRVGWLRVVVRDWDAVLELVEALPLGRVGGFFGSVLLPDLLVFADPVESWWVGSLVAFRVGGCPLVSLDWVWGLSSVWDWEAVADLSPVWLSVCFASAAGEFTVAESRSLAVGWACA